MRVALPARGAPRLGGAVAAALIACAAAGCKSAATDIPDTATSPQAKAEPAPLANLPAAAGTTSLAADAGPRPEPLRSDTALPTDVPHESVRELGGKEAARDPSKLAGYELVALVHTGDAPPAPKAPEVNPAAVDAARRKTEMRITIDASQTRARFVLSGAFVLPQNTELRARTDHYGHLLLWPGEDGYRVVEPGGMRALFGERRLDVAPLSPAELASSGEGARRLNLRTRRVDIATRAAKATLEVAAFRDAGDGGVLVCRMLLDLINAPPSTPACASDEVPLHAELRWTTQGALVFDVASIVARRDLPASEMAAPPATSGFVDDPPPLPPGEALLSKGDLGALRSGPVDVPPWSARDGGLPPPDSGLLLVNATDELRVAWLDGVPAVWVAPGERMLLPSLVRGRYTLQWRTSLGDAWSAPETLVVPGAAQLGAPDANR